MIPYDQPLKLGAVRGGLSVSAGIPGRFSCCICVEVKSIDMARYKVQKGPMCQTCVPVPLCRKIFGGKAHRWHVFFVAYDFIYEVFNVMYILFVSYTV